jgi:hypothetical protein
MSPEEFAREVAALIDARTRALSDRLDGVEAMVKSIPAPRDGRDGLPGVQGPQGEPGKDGKDGALTVEDIPVEYDGARTITIFGKSIRFPVMIYKGVYQPGSEYEPEDAVTYGGSVWRCKSATTAQPGNGSKDWMLIVKAGRDGRDYKGA